MNKVTIYTDGACAPNPGRGGWAALLECRNHRKMISGGEKNTTNNRMEVRAIVEGLKALKKPCLVVVVSDSKYALNCCSGKWNPKSNHDLFAELESLAKKHTIGWDWVRGHNGHEENERVDAEAYRQIALQ